MSSDSAGQFSSGSLPIAGGFIYGALAYVVAFIATVGFLILQRPETGEELQNTYQFGSGTGAGGEMVLNILGWIFYNAQTVPLQITGRDGTQITVNLLEELGVSSPLVNSAVPAVVLLVFGIILAQRASATSAESGVAAGAALVVGYGVLAVAGALFFRVSEQGLTYQVQLSRAVVVVGIAYPVVGGAIGGLIRVALS